MAEPGSLVWALHLLAGILSTHMGQLAPRVHRIPAGNRDGRTARTVPWVVATVQGLRFPRVRAAAPDSTACLGSARDHHASGVGNAYRVSDLPRIFLRHDAQHHARGRI